MMPETVQDILTAGNVFTFSIGDPSAYKTTIENEERLKNRNSGDPEQGPPPEPGDKYIIVAAVLGILIGGIAGFFIGRYGFGQGAMFIGIFVGIFLGGLIGTYVGDRIKKNHSEEQDEINAGP